MALVALLVFLMSDKTTTTNEPEITYDSKFLSCKSSGIAYPFFTYNNTTQGELEISAIFIQDALDTISLKYTLFYDNQEQARQSQASNHAAMDLSFYDYGLSANSFNANYSVLDNSMRMSLYATKNNFNQIAARYFMVSSSDNSAIPKTLTEFETEYQKGGFNCKIKE